MGRRANEELTSQTASGQGPASGGQAGAGVGGLPTGGSQQQPPVEPKPAGTSQPEGTAGTTAPSSGPETAPLPGPLPGLPEGMGLEEYVAQAVQKVKAEYEGKGGHLAKLKASYERKLAEARQAQTADAERVMEQALKLAEKDPQQALQMLTGQLQQYQERDQYAVRESQMAEWAAGVMEELGLESSDPAVLKIVDEVGPLTRPGADYELLGQLAKHATVTARQEAKTYADKVRKFEEDLPNLVRQQVQTLIVDSGAKRVDASDPTAPPPRDENPIASIQNPDKLLSMGLAQVGKRPGQP